MGYESSQLRLVFNIVSIEDDAAYRVFLIYGQHRGIYSLQLDFCKVCGAGIYPAGMAIMDSGVEHFGAYEEELSNLFA